MASSWRHFAVVSQPCYSEYRYTAGLYSLNCVSGLYTLLFGYAICMSMTSLMTKPKLTTEYRDILLRKDNKRIYASVLLLLWLLVMLTFSFDWEYHRSAFVTHGDSPLDIAEAVISVSSAEWIIIADNTLSVSCNWLADALLVLTSGQ